MAVLKEYENRMGNKRIQRVRMRPTFHRMTSYLSKCQFSKLQNVGERQQMEEQTSDDQCASTRLVPQPSH